MSSTQRPLSVLLRFFNLFKSLLIVLFLVSVSVLTSFGLSALSPRAFAYTPTVTASGVPVRWKGQVKINLAGNPINSSGLSAGDFRAALVRSLQRWQEASGGMVSFDYWQ